MWIATPLCLIAFVVYWVLRPSTELIISRETTYITAPVVNGRPDYLAWWNAHLSEGVTSENNAAVLMFQVLSPELVDLRVRARFYGILGIDEPSQEQQLISLKQFLDSQSLDLARRKVIEDAVPRIEGPISATDFPELAAWVELNAAPLAILEEAGLRERCYIPVLDANFSSSILTSSPVSLFQFRNAMQVLQVRCMLRLESGNVEGACADALTLHRLGRHLSHQGHLLARLIGIAQVWPSREILLSGKLDLPTIRRFRQQLRELLPFPPGGSVLLGERIGMIEQWLTLYDNPPSGMKVLRPHDPNGMLREINEYFDEYEKLMAIPQIAERHSALLAFSTESKSKYLKSAGAGAAMRVIRGFLSRCALQEVTWELALGNVSSDTRYFAQTEFRLQLENIGAAVIEHRARTGQLPSSLEDLVPEELESVPLDAFNHQPLQYIVEDGKFRIFSAGVSQLQEMDAAFFGDLPKKSNSRPKPTSP